MTNVAFPHSTEHEVQLTAQKAEPSILSTVRGITRVCSDEEANASDSIRANREFDSNENDESDSHAKKHDEQRISTLRGMIIDSRDELENACDSIRVNREFDSNEIDESESHSEKHDVPRISIVDGISMCDACDMLAINLRLTTSNRKLFSTTNLLFPGSIEHDDKFRPQNADPSIN
jgi:hypothetical protein